MIIKEETWKSFDGADLAVSIYESNKKAKASILLIHGLGEHSGRYKEWAKLFSINDYNVVIPDLRGHGNSSGIKGHVSSYSVLMRDIYFLREKILELFPEMPFILYGHSLGGNIAANFVIKHSNLADKLILSSPWLKLAIPLNNMELMIGNLMSNLTPRIKVSNRIKSEYLSKDMEAVQAHKNDPLIYDKISLRLFSQAYEKGVKASASIYKINIPLLVMHGKEDKVTSFKATNQFVQNAGGYTKFIPWEGAYHELHNDINKQKVFKAVLDWLEDR